MKTKAGLTSHGWRRLAVTALVTVILAGALPAQQPDSRTPEPPEERQAREVLGRWIEAIGGGTQIKGLQTAFIQCKIDYGSGLPAVDLLVRGAPGLYRMEYTTPAFGTLIQAFDGLTAWQYNEVLGFGFQTTQEHNFNLVMTDFHAPLRLGSRYPYRRLLPKETIDGRQLQPVQLRTAGGREEKWYFDPATGYRVRAELPGPSAASPVVLEFEDFRPVSGALVKEPYRTIRREGDRKTTVTMQVVLYNESMDMGLFSAPAGPTEDNRQLQALFRRNAYLRASLDQVKTRVTDQVVRITTSGLEIPTRVYQKRPNLLAVVQDTPGVGKAWQGYDGKIGWAWNEVEGYREMQGAELQQMLGGADLEGPLKLSAACPFRRLLEEKLENGRTLVGVALASMKGVEGNFYFDQQTAELVRVETFVQTGANGQLKVTAEFSDYRMVDGLLMPHLVTVTNPAMRMETRVRSVEHNVPIDDAIFAPKKDQ
ncbi:MAG TPA: hypothetical protein VG734_08645 [Lacunisphaera sp.]|nr:hypothetical protein [Lacunisphaera sp.]